MLIEERDERKERRKEGGREGREGGTSLAYVRRMFDVIIWPRSDDASVSEVGKPDGDGVIVVGEVLVGLIGCISVSRGVLIGCVVWPRSNNPSVSEVGKPNGATRNGGPYVQ